MEGKFDKFTVLKNEDIDKYCTESQVEALNDICRSISFGRLSDNKRIGHTYMIINTDEPYAEEIVEILKRNGHWD